MTQRITGIDAIGPKPVQLDPRTARVARTDHPTAPQSFKEFLAESVGEVHRLQSEAETTIKELVSGKLKDVNQAMVAVEKADLAFRTMVSVRNKMVAAYEEIMRMQV